MEVLNPDLTMSMTPSWQISLHLDQLAPLSILYACIRQGKGQDNEHGDRVRQQIEYNCVPN